MAAASDERDEFSGTDKRHLVELVDDLRRSNAALQAETEMFERYISRIEPRHLITQAMSETLGGTSQTEMAAGRGQRAKARTTALDRLQCLTVEQKCDITQREIDETREELRKLKESSESAMHSYRATLEVADIRLAEVKKESYDFDRDVAKALLEKKSILMRPEKVIHYCEDRMRAKDTLVEKLRLKNASLKVQKRKLQLQLQQEEEMGEALHEVDFQQLKIENSKFLERIDERNLDLLRLKLLAGNTLQVLNSYKKKLQDMTCESKLLSSDITSHNDMLLKIDAETVQAEEERAKAEAQNRWLRRQLAEFRVPPVLQYISANASHRELEQSIPSWERKVAISQMALKTHTKALNQLLAETQ